MLRVGAYQVGLRLAGRGMHDLTHSGSPDDGLLALWPVAIGRPDLAGLGLASAGQNQGPTTQRGDESSIAGASDSRTEQAPDQMEEPMAFRPYLFFGGNCRQAFTRYHEIFGGDLTLITMNDVPGDPPSTDQAGHKLLMGPLAEYWF